MGKISIMKKIIVMLFSFLSCSEDVGGLLVVLGLDPGPCPHLRGPARRIGTQHPYQILLKYNNKFDNSYETNNI